MTEETEPIYRQVRELYQVCQKLNEMSGERVGSQWLGVIFNENTCGLYGGDGFAAYDDQVHSELDLESCRKRLLVQALDVVLAFLQDGEAMDGADAPPSLRVELKTLQDRLLDGLDEVR